MCRLKLSVRFLETELYTVVAIASICVLEAEPDLSLYRRSRNYHPLSGLLSAWQQVLMYESDSQLQEDFPRLVLSLHVAESDTQWIYRQHLGVTRHHYLEMFSV